MYAIQTPINVPFSRLFAEHTTNTLDNTWAPGVPHFNNHDTNLLLNTITGLC